MVTGETLTTPRPKGSPSENYFSIEDEESLVSLLEYNIKAAGYKFEFSLNGYDGMLKIQS